MDYPLVSAITPTYNRREFFPRAVGCFLAQDYPNLEWVILDDGSEPIQDLLPADPRIKYFRDAGNKYNHGTKMNLCFEKSQGEICIVFDDDDWYPFNRITRQIMPFIERPTLIVDGTSTLYYYRHGTEQAWRYTSPKGIGWLASMAVRKSAWQNMKFDHITAGADYNFQKKTLAAAKLDLFDPTLVVAAIHRNNAGRKNVSSEYKPESWETIKRLWQEQSAPAGK
jgi:glycosyltransferase involved in cell wall biosynthesis